MIVTSFCKKFRCHGRNFSTKSFSKEGVLCYNIYKYMIYGAFKSRFPYEKPVKGVDGSG